LNKVEELLKEIGGKKAKTFIEQGLSEWLEKEFRTFIRDKKINDILN
jgi:hypothetical protein